MVLPLRWLKSIINRIFPNLSPPQIDEMDKAIDTWLNIYQDKPPWLEECHGNTLNLGASVAAEFARLIMIELDTKITALTSQNTKRAEFLNKQYQRLIKSLRIQLEKACARGGIIFKPYVSNYKIYTNYIMQGNFLPLEFDEDRLTDVVCLDQFTDGKTIYTRLERHTYNGSIHTIESKAFVTNQPDTLGHEIDLKAVKRWADIEPLIEIKNVDRPLFAFWRVPSGNTTDENSPLGMSVYGKAIKQLRQSDKQWDRILWEFEGSELAIDASESMLRVRLDDNGNPKYQLPETSKRLFRSFEISDTGSDFYKVFNPEIRDQNLLNGLDALKREIEFKVALAYGTISNPQNVDRTAEEIRSSKHRSFAAVSDMQKSLESALEDYIYAINTLTSVNNLAPDGIYQTQYNWGDGILEDTDKETKIKLQEVATGIISPEAYLKWRYDYTAEQIAEVMPQRSGFQDYFDGG